MNRTWAPLLVGAIVYAIGAAWAAVRLPAAGVALHIDAAGVVDRVGSRADAVGLVIGLGAFLLALGVALVLVARRGPLRLLNIPHRTYWLTPEREPRLRTMLGADIAGIMGVTLVFLTLVPISLVRATTAPLPPAAFWVPIAAYTVGVLAWATWLIRHRYRPAG